MYLFFDTETTGLPKSWKAPVTDLGNWPHIVQIAWAIFDEDGKRIAFHDYIIKPEDFVIPESATAIHGISTARALKKGRPAAEVLKEFSGAILDATRLVAHNLDFDEKMVRVELLRQGMPDVLGTIPMPKICTMKNSTAYCKIPGPYGDKWPKLSELHIKLFEVDFEDQHNAASDVLCCAKCFFELKRHSVICDSLSVPS
ncbi:MAG: DNA polymerase III subunit epsilon [Omnitrophica bacterium RIFOXYB12_FULL_50_7]|nr:MAG: DNA polymerase III subunit epsilon [Omnitrophica bacterium RIFOXYB12_FULL_50_7]